MSVSVPPRFVPTLTEIVAQQLILQTPVDVDTAMSVAHDGSEAMVQRVLHRVDLVLESRLNDAIRQLVLEQTQTLLPLLREEIKRLVRESISQAFEQDAASSQTPHDDHFPG